MNDNLLAAFGWRDGRPPRSLLVVAHPDDETIGLGGHLRELPAILIVHVTDGAPRDPSDAPAHGFADAASYAAARRRELREVLALAGLDDKALLALGFPDQEASLNLAKVTHALVALFAERQPEMIFTHAYEGGHPDHDATAFAVRAALHIRQAQGLPIIPLIEIPFYHSENGAHVRQRFAAGATTPVVMRLSPAARDLKGRMFACFATQRHVLKDFDVDQESFRSATPCDFSAPPNQGDILYESFGWDFTCADFLTHVRAAMTELGVPESL